MGCENSRKVQKCIMYGFPLRCGEGEKARCIFVSAMFLCMSASCFRTIEFAKTMSLLSRQNPPKDNLMTLDRGEVCSCACVFNFCSVPPDGVITVHSCMPVTVRCCLHYFLVLGVCVIFREQTETTCYRKSFPPVRGK